MIFQILVFASGHRVCLPDLIMNGGGRARSMSISVIGRMVLTIARTFVGFKTGDAQSGGACFSPTSGMSGGALYGFARFFFHDGVFTPHHGARRGGYEGLRPAGPSQTGSQRPVPVFISGGFHRRNTSLEKPFAAAVPQHSQGMFDG